MDRKFSGENPEQQDAVERELRKRIASRFMQHADSLYSDAAQRQLNALTESKSKKLSFRDIFITETSIDTPFDKAYAVLLTRTGDWLRPGEPQDHFYVYFPVVEAEAESPASPTSLLCWIDKIDENGERVRYTITDDSVDLAHDLEDYQAGGQDYLNTSSDTSELVLTYPAIRELFNELKTYRIAPQDHVPINPPSVA